MHVGANVGPGTVLGGDFRIEQSLGRGGMGTVYRATQLSTHRERAVKVLHAALVTDPVTVTRFVEEARIGARIRSEHVVDVIAAGVDRSTQCPWLAMELLEGEDLASHVDRAGAITTAALRPLMAQLRHALEPAHGLGIVHRDLKPENLFLCRPRRHGAQTMLKVLDFGIAKSLAEGRAAGTATAPIGSPLFMAPEQAEQGGHISASTDVWAMGLIVFYALTGEHFWMAARGARNLQAILSEILLGSIPRPSERARQLEVSTALPRELDDWFAGCVDRDPGQRFHAAGACLAALDSVLAGAQRTPAAFAPTVASPSRASARPAVVVSPAPLRQRHSPVPPTEAMPDADRPRAPAAAPTAAPATPPHATPPHAMPTPAMPPPATPPHATPPHAMPPPATPTIARPSPVAPVETAPARVSVSPSEADEESVPPPPSRFSRGTLVVWLLVGAMALGGLYAGAQLYSDFRERTGGLEAHRATFASAAVDPDAESAVVTFTGPDAPTFRVRVDGRLQGRPPVTVRLRPGVHFVDLLDDNQDVLFDWLAVYGGERLSIALRPLRPTSDRPIPAGHGGFAATVDSDTSVHIDGQPIDASQAWPIAAGVHEVRLSTPNGDQVETIPVQLIEGRWVGVRRQRRSLARRQP